MLKFLEFLRPVTNLVSEFVEDKDKANIINARIQHGVIDAMSKELEARSNIIIAEANGESYLQRNWRPLVMIWFAFLVGLHWFGMTPNNMSDEVIQSLLEIVKIGIGGYVVGRSCEKIVKNYKGQ